MKQFLLDVLKRNAYFILAAAWLFTFAFIINNYRTGSSSPRYLHRAIEKQVQEQEKDFIELTQNLPLLHSLVDQQYSVKTLQSFTEKPYIILIYHHDEYREPPLMLKFWNSQSILPGNDLLLSQEKNRFVRLSNGQYECIRIPVKGKKGEQLLAIALIPIRKEYFIENSNLKREFVGLSQAEKSVAITKEKTNYPVNSSFGNTLFYLQPKTTTALKSSNAISTTFTLVGIVLLLLFINNAAHAISDRFGRFKGSIFLVATIALLRLLTYVYPSILNLRQFGLFDPSVYSSNKLLSSLGDLLIDSFLVCWLVLFVRKEAGNKTFASYKNTKRHWWVVAASLTVYVIAGFAAANIIQSLIGDAKISFNVTNFFSLDKYSFVGFIILASLSFAYFFLSQIIIRLVRPLVEDNKFGIYIIIAVIGLLILTFVRQTNFVELNIYVLAWLLAYTWLMMQQSFITDLRTRLNISEVLFWIVIFSVSISAVIIVENSRIEWEQRKRTAEKLSLQADPSSERLLSIALTYFDNDFLYSNFDRFKVPSYNLYLKDSLVNKNFSAYLSKYDTRIYTFDKEEHPLYNEDPVSYDTLNTIFRIEGKHTTVNDLRYFENSFDKFSYISKKTVVDTIGEVVGYVFLLAEPKRYKSDALIPELFKQKKDYLPNEYSPIYSYAIYNDGELIDYYNDYAFPTQLNLKLIPKRDFTQVHRDGYNELWYRDNNKVVVIARVDNYVIDAITLFAYLFTTFLLLVVMFRVIAIIIQSRLHWHNLRQYLQPNIRAQIHSTIIFISIFSFLVIGAATIVFFINRYNKNKQERLSRTIQIVTNEMQNQLVSKGIFEDMVRLYESGASEELERMIDRIAEIHGTDINVYNIEGDLKVSSNPFIYNKGILSEKMSPSAFYYMHNQKLVQYVNEEELGGIAYQSVYCPVRDEKGNAYAYLNIPSFDSQEELKREISNFLVTIINLNAFILLIAGIIALIITNRITSYFSLIGTKMNQINLGKTNEEIEWKRNDEIGGLVTEYNKMVRKLEDSAAALAKSEREGAWREMARQVAHEIKNPLTPMKLSIQYLQKAIDNNSDNVKQLSSNVAKTLIEQIDHLSKIASDFSQFANIGNVKNEFFDLHEILQSLSALYGATENLQFEWQPLPHKVYVLADRTQLNRLFTNLIQNAVEACAKNDCMEVRVEESLQDDSILIKVSDNGPGIPAATREKIFTPNFTTKSSGTGLGLAMSKSIVEQAKGKIWFETSEGRGTTFFVLLPVAHT